MKRWDELNLGVQLVCVTLAGVALFFATVLASEFTLFPVLSFCSCIGCNALDPNVITKAYFFIGVIGVLIAWAVCINGKMENRSVDRVQAELDATKTIISECEKLIEAVDSVAGQIDVATATNRQIEEYKRVKTSICGAHDGCEKAYAQIRKILEVYKDK